MANSNKLSQWFKRQSRRVSARFRPHTPSNGDPHISYNPTISPEDLSSAARKVIKYLQDAGHEAYAVGGCIRDLLLGGDPKDFDVATSATPEEVRKLFRNSRIVGRRFQIVHVRFGREMIEVTTFRAHHGDSQCKKTAKQASSGMLLRDNVYGNLASDAARRDFTINAFYYDPRSEQIYDYAKGLADLKRHQIQIIGDGETRYREDPVRMLRAIRFAAKLDFDLARDTARPIRPLGYLLGDIAAARLFDEVLKLLAAGYGHRTLLLLQEYQLFGRLFPATEKILRQDTSGFYQRFIEQAMLNTDERLRDGKRITPAFLLGALLWPPLVEAQKHFEASGDSPQVALQKAANGVLDQQISRVAIPRRFTTTMREIWELQLRLPRRGGSRAFRLLEHPRFRAAYDFVLLREQAGEDCQDLGQWWTAFQEAGEKKRQQLVDSLFPARPKRRRGPKKERG